MKFDLKKTQYDSRVESLFLIVVGSIGCAIILYTILTKTIEKSNLFVIAGFSLFAVFLLLGIWALINKKISEYVNINGWKYKLFRKVKKYQFILITGAIDATEFSIIIFLLYYFQKLSMHNAFQWKDLLVHVFCFLSITLLTGYRDYKKYSSIDMDSGFECNI
jgi:hypothetical protein